MPDDLIGEIAQERENQNRQWGGSAHDDLHEWYEWLWYIEYQMSRIDAQLKGSARDRLIKIAALAIAAVESLDRKEKSDAR